MVDKTLKEILFFSYEENLSSDYKSTLKNNIFKNFLKQNKECAKIPFEFILFCSLYFKIYDGIPCSQRFAILNEEYIINEDIEKFLNKIIIIPYYIQDKWGLILIDYLYKSIKIKIIASNKIYQGVYLFLENIIHKLNGSIKIEKLENKIETIHLDDEFNSSKIVINFINELLEQDDIDEYVQEYFNDNFNIINKAEKEIYNESLNLLINKLLEKIDKDYDKLFSDYLNYINLINANNKEKEINNEYIPNQNEDNEIHFRESQNEKVKDKNNLNKNLENPINKGEKTKIGEKYDEIAKNITKDIMNLDFSNKIKSENIQKKYKNKKMDLIKKKKPKFDKIKLEDEDEEMFNVDINTGINQKNSFENKQIDETTKNTINDILEYVLKEMKSKKRLFKRKYSQKNKTAKINEHKQIEIIEEEDKESSTSEMCKEKILRGIRDSISSINNFSFKEELRESYKNRKMTLDNKINDKKDEKDLHVKNKNVKIFSEKGKIINTKRKIINSDLIDNKIKVELKEKGKKQVKNEILINQKENFIKININDNNKTKIKDNSDILKKNSNHKSSKSNNIIENNSFNIQNFELEISKPYKIKDNTVDNKQLISLSPKDNKKNLRKKNIKQQFENNQKNVIFKNVINENNKINNISINTIKTENIIIINNNIIKKSPKPSSKNVPIKSNNTKEPEDVKIPKDSKSKKKNAEIKLKTKLKDKSKNSNKENLSIKEGFSYNKPMKINPNQKELKYALKNKIIKLNESYERRHSDADQYQPVNDNNQKGNDYINPFNRKNISDKRIKNFGDKNEIFMNNKKGMNKTIENIINANYKKNVEKSDSNKKALNNKNNNLKKRLVKSKTQDFEKSKKSPKKGSGFQNIDFFNLNTDCIIN